MLHYQVNFRGVWVSVQTGILLIDGRLAWWHGSLKGIAPAPYWMLTEATRTNPVFRAACWESLTDEEKAHSLERRKLKVSIAA